MGGIGFAAVTLLALMVFPTQVEAKTTCEASVFKASFGAHCDTSTDGDEETESVRRIEGNPAGTGLLANLEKEWAEAALKKYGGFRRYRK